MEQDYKQQMRRMTDGLDQWCHRRSARRATARRGLCLVAAVSVTVAVAALLMPPAGGMKVQGSRSGDPQWAASTVCQILSEL